MESVNEMKFTRHGAMKGYVFIDVDGVDTEDELEFLI